MQMIEPTKHQIYFAKFESLDFFYFYLRQYFLFKFT